MTLLQSTNVFLRQTLQFLLSDFVLVYFSLPCFNLFQNISQNNAHILSITCFSVEVIIAVAVFRSTICIINNISSSNMSSVQILIVIIEMAVLVELCGKACW